MFAFKDGVLAFRSLASCTGKEYYCSMEIGRVIANTIQRWTVKMRYCYRYSGCVTWFGSREKGLLA